MPWIALKTQPPCSEFLSSCKMLSFELLIITGHSACTAAGESGCPVVGVGVHLWHRSKRARAVGRAKRWHRRGSRSSGPIWGGSHHYCVPTRQGRQQQSQMAAALATCMRLCQVLIAAKLSAINKCRHNLLTAAVSLWLVYTAQIQRFCPLVCTCADETLFVLPRFLQICFPGSWKLSAQRHCGPNALWYATCSWHALLRAMLNSLGWLLIVVLCC